MSYALLGRRLGHSYSAMLHRGYGLAYDLVEVEPERLGDFVAHCTLDGFNVTVPYKQQIIPYLAALSPLAARLGAVNTVRREADGLVGYNTDYAGLAGALDLDGVDVRGKTALVLGTGGAARVAQAVLADRGARVYLVSRSGPIDYTSCYDYDAQVVVNATPVGTYPDPNAPLELAPFAHLQYVFDLVYNPFRTSLLLEAHSLGVRHRNGLAMLVIQALEARKIWQGVPYTPADVAACMARITAATRNIALVGMPSSGKSTIGRALARALGREWLDTDDMVCAATGSTPEAIIRTQGEPTFRDIEQGVVEQACARRGVVISLGGGSVLRPANQLRLRQTALVVWVQRDLDSLDDSGRPTLQAMGAAGMYHTRAPIYEMVSDLVIINTDIQEAVDTIARFATQGDRI